jgi:hypothetical protein
VSAGLSRASSAPKILKSLLAQFRIPGGVLDGAMAEPILNCPRVVPCVGQGIAVGVAEHVHVNLEGEAGAVADALDQPIDRIGGERAAALRRENIAAAGLALQFAKGAQLVAARAFTSLASRDFEIS